MQLILWRNSVILGVFCLRSICTVRLGSVKLCACVYILNYNKESEHTCYLCDETHFSSQIFHFTQTTQANIHLFNKVYDVDEEISPLQGVLIV